MKIASLDLDSERGLIAEIGNNHEGNPEAALKLADAAVDSGADLVKVQIIEPHRLVNRAEEKRIAQLTSFKLDRDVFLEMARRVRARGAMFMASVFDCESLIEWAPQLDAIKIASGDLNFDQLLVTAARTGKPIVLSTGMSTYDEIARAVGVIKAELPKDVPVSDRLVLLHCVSLYPAGLEQVNLSAMVELRERLGLTVGYSDHTLGLDAALMSLALGARVVEKHFTLDRNYSAFRDHSLSSEPMEFFRLAEALNSADAMMGKGFSDEERVDSATRKAARRCIVTKRAIDAGAQLTADDLDYIRPATGFSPADAHKIIGRRAVTSLPAHHVLHGDDLL